jgi:hypothetical protein
MSEPEHAESASTSSVTAQLHEVARLLRSSDHLEPEAQQALAELADELANRFSSVPPSAEEVHLAETTAHLVETLRQGPEEGSHAAARDRLEKAIIAAEVRFPTIAGLARRFLDALANLGI